MEAKIPITEELLQIYCDGLADPAQAEAVERAMAENPGLAEKIKLQSQIDRSLQHCFAAEAPEVDRIVAALEAGSLAKSPSLGMADDLRRKHRRRLVLAAVAAGLFWVLVGASLWWESAPQPYFEKTPLVALYQQAVDRGFKPYYHCEDPARFAATFSKRQSIPLQLAPTPPEERMLGLSYPGGLSRDTTAMLSLVDETPVMVFVDRLAVDDPAAVAAETESLNVFREERDGLVFYEVSPLPEPRMIDYLVVPDSRD